MSVTNPRDSEDEPSMSTNCPECGAPVPAGGSCRDNFHALLLLESQVTEEREPVSHFYAVASYCLQHPESMNFTAEALAGLRSAVADSLDGRATINEIRARARRGAKAAGGVTRSAGDPVPRWPVSRWETTVADVCGGGVDGYAERVHRWARSIRSALDTSQP